MGVTGFDGIRWSVVDVQGLMLTLTRIKQVNATSIYDKMIAAIPVSAEVVSNDLVLA